MIIMTYNLRHFILNNLNLNLNLKLSLLDSDNFDVVIPKDIIASFIALFTGLSLKGFIELIIEMLFFPEKDTVNGFIYKDDNSVPNTSFMDKGNKSSNVYKSGGSYGGGSSSKAGGSYSSSDEYESSDSDKGGSRSKETKLDSKYKGFRKPEYVYPIYPNAYMDDHDLLQRTDFSRKDKVDLDFFKTIPTEKLSELLFLAEDYKRAQQSMLSTNPGAWTNYWKWFKREEALARIICERVSEESLESSKAKDKLRSEVEMKGKGKGKEKEV